MWLNKLIVEMQLNDNYTNTPSVAIHKKTYVFFITWYLGFPLMWIVE